ncbi:hypothetical protein GJ496_000826 [Pomphorhynchus laevis]|nr:hypothetical protein GJ496_000826 [Pomphorhynchus laevis]
MQQPKYVAQMSNKCGQNCCATMYNLKLEVYHGSAVHYVWMQSCEPLRVCHLQQYLYHKTCVPTCMQRLYYKGQYLHRCPKALLSDFYVFNNSRMQLVGTTCDKHDPRCKECYFGMNN